MTPTTLATPAIAAQCGQCKHFVAARIAQTDLFGAQPRPSYCKMLAAIDAHSLRDPDAEVCGFYKESAPF